MELSSQRFGLEVLAAVRSPNLLGRPGTESLLVEVLYVVPQAIQRHVAIRIRNPIRFSTDLSPASNVTWAVAEGRPHVGTR